MSKRRREEDDEPMPLAKYARSEEMGLVDLLLMDGLNQVFFQSLLGPLSQRALCCVKSE